MGLREDLTQMIKKNELEKKIKVSIMKAGVSNCWCRRKGKKHEE